MGFLPAMANCPSRGDRIEEAVGLRMLKLAISLSEAMLGRGSRGDESGIGRDPENVFFLRRQQTKQHSPTTRSRLE